MDIIARNNERNLYINRIVGDGVGVLSTPQQPQPQMTPCSREPLIGADNEKAPETPIQEFYSGSNIFITGGTGNLTLPQCHSAPCSRSVTKTAFFFFFLSSLLSRCGYRFHGENANRQIAADVHQRGKCVSADQTEEGQRHSHPRRGDIRRSGKL